MASVNKVIAIGNLGKDPETRYSAGGDAVCNWSIACTEKWKDKAGEAQEKTEWIRCVAFGRTAEVAGEYLNKGDPCYVEGRLQTRKYEKDGVEKYATEVIVDRLQLLGGKRDSGGEQQERPARAAKPSGGGGGKTNASDFDDDIPF